jgi:hypothetical protein
MTGPEKDAPDAPHRQFKGVWICARLWLTLDLTTTEKFLVAVIDSLSGKGHACFAGNDYFAKHLFVSETHMRDMLADLTNLGYVVRLAFTGRQTLRCVHPDVSSDPSGCKQLMKEFKVPESCYRIKPRADSCRVNPRAAIGSNQAQLSDKTKTDTPNREQNRKTTTKTSSPKLVANGHKAERAEVVVALSSVAGEGDEPRDIADKLTEEFGLSIPQGREVETFLASKGDGYVLNRGQSS